MDTALVCIYEFEFFRSPLEEGQSCDRRGSSLGAWSQQRLLKVAVEPGGLREVCP